MKAVNLGHPICSGLVFTADEVGWFKIAKSRFAGTKKQQYDKWLSERREGEPVSFWEPVGAFELKDTDKSIEFELDYKRPARYIYLLPTSLKKCSKKFEETEICMDFFGVKGRVMADDERVNTTSAAQISGQGITNFKLEILSIEGEGIQKPFPEDCITMRRKSQINGIDFVSPSSAESLKHIPVSTTTYLSVRISNKNNKVLLRCPSDSVKSLKIIRHEHQTVANTTEMLVALNGDKNIRLVSNLLEQLAINPFLAEEFTEKIDLEKFLCRYVLSEKENIYEVEVFLKIL